MDAANRQTSPKPSGFNPQTQNRLLSDGSAWDCYRFAVEHRQQADVNALGLRVAATDRTGRECLNFVKDVIADDRNEDLGVLRKLLELKVLDNGFGDVICEYAASVKGADLEAFQRWVLHQGSARDCYRLAADVSGVDMQALADRVIKDWSERLLIGFAGLPRAPVKRLSEVMARRGSASGCRMFCKLVAGADIEALMARVDHIEKGQLPFYADSRHWPFEQRAVLDYLREHGRAVYRNEVGSLIRLGPADRLPPDRDIRFYRLEEEPVIWTRAESEGGPVDRVYAMPEAIRRVAFHAECERDRQGMESIQSPV